MEKIFVNGQIQTLDSTGRVYQAVGVRHGRIEALGVEDEIRRMTSSGTEVIDLKGAVMFPGFIDSHNHLIMFAYLVNGIDLSSPFVRKIDDIIRLVKAETEQVQSGTWVKGYRFAEYKLAENRYPTRHDLDAVSPENPVILYHTSFHACVLNSLALQEIGITKETKAQQGGVIEKDADIGEPTGVLFDADMMNVFNDLFNRDLNAMTTSERVTMCSTGTAKFAEAGLVGAADALVTPISLTVYQETLAAGMLKVRVYTMNDLTNSEHLIEAGVRTGLGNNWLKIGPIKIFEDGGMSSRTAAVTTPYLTPPHDHGLKVYSREELITTIKRLHPLGYQIAIHSQGDDGLNDTLDAFESVLGSHSQNPLRHRIEHAGCLYPRLLERAANMNIAISSQPAFFSELGDGWIEAFGRETANRLYPFKSMLRAGIPLGGSSDCPVISHDPRIGLRDAVLRRTHSGEILGPDEALSMDEALRMFTYGSAYLAFEENIGGTIEIGKRADFTVLEADPREVPIEEVPEIPVKMTIVEGKIVFSD